MPLAKLTFRPGVNRETTSYANEMGWYDSSLIRFRKGRPEKMGGWSKLSSGTIEGTPRALHTWVALDAAQYMAVGTNQKYYIEEGGTYNDITPLRATATLTDPFTTTSGSSVVTVADDAHGASTGDWVTFSGSAAVQGVAAASLNTNLQITVVDANSYTVDTGDSATGAGTGGGTGTAQYEIVSGLDEAVGGIGWGAGLWGGLSASYSQNALNMGSGLSDSATSIILDSASDFETVATTLDGAITSSNGTGGTEGILVADSSSFPAKGTILVGSEKIIYTSNASNKFSGLTRGADGTTAAAGSDGASVTFVGLILIGSELIQYTGKTSNTLDAGVVRGVRGTTAAAHADDAVVKEANSFVGWGLDSDITSTSSARLRLWFQDNYGEDLAFNPIDDIPYYWDKTLTVNTRATALSAQSGAADAPTVTRQIMLSGDDRHLICFGSNEFGGTDQNLLHIRWSDQENPFVWTPKVTNTSGGFTISTGSEIIRAIRTRQEILVFTDVNLHSLRFIGPPLVFGLSLVASNTTLISPNSVVAVADMVFWMSKENFHVFTGRTEVLPCTVLRYIFDDINLEQQDKIVAGCNRMFDEVFWFYPSADSTENDRYVKFNFTEKTWDIGTLSRTAWVDFGIHENPRGAGSDSGTQYIYIHEDGEDADGSAMTSYVESADIDLDPDGTQFMFVSRIIPDVAVNSAGSVNYVLKTRNYPGDSLTTNSTSEVVATTQQSFVRSRSRQIALRVESSSLSTAWTLGETRIDLRPDGRR